MIDLDSNRKKIYDEIVNLILNLHLQKNVLTKEEMHCLLSILDLVMMGKDDLGLVSLLREWEDSRPDSELRDIVHATLVNIDFSDMLSQVRNIDTIRDLLRYNNSLRD